MTIYSIPTGKAPELYGEVGSAIRDMPQDSTTTAKKAYNDAVERITIQFHEDSAAYDKALPSLLEKKLVAEKDIDNARLKNTIGLIATIATVVATIGLAICSITLRSVPFGLSAFACGLLFIPSGLIQGHFSSTVARLEKDIDAPTSLKPKLQLPTYQQEHDLELRETRSRIKNELAETRTIKRIANSGYGRDQILSFALLDGLAPKEGNARKQFYAKAVQLIDAYTQNQKIREDAVIKVEEQFEKQKDHFIPQGYRFRHAVGISKMSEAGDALNRQWKEDALRAVQAEFKNAESQIEREFAAIL